MTARTALVPGGGGIDGRIFMPDRPDVAPGTVLRLADGQWAYGRGQLVLRVERVRWELARYYDEEQVWVEGQQLSADGVEQGRIQALVPVVALWHHR